MQIVLWIIAACEVIRAVQNAIQLHMLSRDRGARENAYSEFVRSLKKSDREFLRELLEEFERQEDHDGI